MSAAELAWRAQSSARGMADRVRFSLGFHAWHDAPPSGRYPETLTRLPLPLHPGPLDATLPSVGALIAAADAVVAHRFSFLNLERVDVGNPVDWNRDHETGTPAPLGFAAAIDYRDPRIAGDAKLVWEPSRHLQLATLGRAFRATGDVAYAREGLRQIESWIAQCPFGSGMQWRSPLELAIRAINWTWFLALIAPSGLLAGAPLARLLHVLDAHVQDITRKYSRGSSANNHRIGEAAGVFVACSCLPYLSHARDHVAESARILEEEILAQNHPDGGNGEQAFGYHVFVMQFLLAAAYVARATKHRFSDAYMDRLDAMLNFADELTAAGPAPMYGDADDGYVLDLGDRARGGRELLGVGDCLRDRPPRESSEPTSWLFPDAPAPTRPRRPLQSRAFPDTGLCLLQWGDAAAGDAVSLTFDCGPLGFGTLAAHGHADALAFTLRAFGDDVFVDPGTYDYFRFPDWREYFRSTRAHNTITIDDVDQSVMVGPFMWGARAAVRGVEWTQGASARVSAEHDGYRRLPDPVSHRRSIEMRAAERLFTIVDFLQMAAEHQVAMRFHVSERATVRRLDGHRFQIATARAIVELALDARTEIAVLEASKQPRGGWMSRGYHRLAPAATIVASLTASGPLQLESRILVGTAR